MMVSTEYPPMPGGIGRYTANLTNALRKLGQEVLVICNERGKGDYSGISPENRNLSEKMLKLVSDLKPDIIHVQFEPGLYGLHIDPINPSKIKSYIDCFYDECRVPIVTTFHSAYSFREWMSQASIIKRSGKIGKWGIPARAIMRAWKSFINYNSFIAFNKKKMMQSSAGICFSDYLSRLLGGKLKVIYHGADPAIPQGISKEEAKKIFSLPLEKKIAVAIGFRTVTKGWDILDKVTLPKDWIIVSNSSRGHYNRENDELTINNEMVTDLQKGFLSDKELSILFSASDVVLLPYRITSGSGVMFDALSHGLPFVASNLDFFREYASMGLGLVANRNPKAFGDALHKLDKNYDNYKIAVDTFKYNLKWETVAKKHNIVYKNVLSN